MPASFRSLGVPRRGIQFLLERRLSRDHGCYRLPDSGLGPARASPIQNRPWLQTPGWRCRRIHRFTQKTSACLTGQLGITLSLYLSFRTAVLRPPPAYSEVEMKLEYAISVDDFRALQKPFATRPGRNAGFRAVVAVCCVVAALGVYCLVEGMGLLLAGFLVGLAALGSIGSYFLDVHSIRSSKEKYERNIAVAYKRLHCRDHRQVDISPSGFTLSCNCGTVTRPWTELMQFSENERFFLLRTKADSLLLPKSAFSSEGDKTEFRRLATEEINKSRAFAARPLEFVCSGSEMAAARLLHIVQGGAWRAVARSGVILFGVGCILNFFLRSQGGSDDPSIPLKAVGLTFAALVAAMAVRFFQRGGRQNQRLRLYFGNEGFHLEDSATIAKHPWESFCGYLENDGVFLLYHTPRLYRVIPKRIFGPRETEFRDLLRAKLPRFNYRNPVQPRAAQISRTA